MVNQCLYVASPAGCSQSLGLMSMSQCSKRSQSICKIRDLVGPVGLALSYRKGRGAAVSQRENL